MNFFTKVIFTWTIFIASTVRTTNGMSRRFNCTFIMGLWINSILLNIWLIIDRLLYSMSFSIENIIYTCLFISAVIAIVINHSHKHLMPKIITLDRFKNYDVLIYFLSIFVIIFTAFDAGMFILLAIHTLLFIYFYFTKSTFGLKQNENWPG